MLSECILEGSKNPDAYVDTIVSDGLQIGRQSDKGETATDRQVHGSNRPIGSVHRAQNV